MKATKIFHKAIVSFVTSLIAVVPVLSQEISYATIEPTVNAQCVDYPPLGDGFGWNGRCGCMVEPEWKGFGREVAVSGDTIAIGSADTPENCPGSDATVSIYEKSESGDWVKNTEFNFDEEYNGAGVFEFVDGKLEVSHGRNKRRVYEKLGGDWQLVSTFDPRFGPFVESVCCPSSYVQGSQTLIFGDRDSNGNETVQNEVEIDGPGWFINPTDEKIYGDIFIADTRDDVFFFGINSSGNWQLDNRIPFSVPQVTTVFQDSIIVIGLADNMHRWIRDPDGGWVKSEEFVTGLPYYADRDTVLFQSDNKILLQAWGHLRTYMLNSENKLVETDRLELPTQRGGQWSGTPTAGRVAFDGANILNANRFDNVAYVFDVSSNGVIGEASSTERSDVACDYSNADLHDGWGWNASAGTSCPPVVPDDTTLLHNIGVDSNCDYSQADLHGGWGWNATTRQSCAPLESVSNPQVTAQCIDSDGDGWGWDGSATCAP